MATHTYENGKIYTGYFENGYIAVIDKDTTDNSKPDSDVGSSDESKDDTSDITDSSIVSE
jgi:hypothetical protein